MTFQIRIFAFGPHQDNHRKDLRVVYVRYLYLDQLTVASEGISDLACIRGYA